MELKLEIEQNNEAVTSLIKRGTVSPAIAADETPDEFPALIVPQEFLVVDCGNFTNPKNKTGIVESRYTGMMLNEFRYDTVNLGHSECQMPQGELLSLFESNERLPVVSANISFMSIDEPEAARDLNSYIKPFRIVELGKTRVMIIGVTSAHEKKHGLLNELGVSITDPADAIKSHARVMRRSDLVVLLVSDLTEEEMGEVATVEGIDIIVGAPNKLPADFMNAQEVLDVPVLAREGLSRGREIGRIDIRLAPGGGIENSEMMFERLGYRYKDHPLIIDQLKQMKEEIREIQRAEHIALRKIDLDSVVDYKGSQDCEECHADINAAYCETQHASAIKSLEEVKDCSNSLCLPCHTTGYGEPTGFNLVRMPKEMINVGCEACHGPAEVHLQLMRNEEPTGPLVGLSKFGMKPITQSTCDTCHTEITHPEFDFDSMAFQIHSVP